MRHIPKILLVPVLILCVESAYASEEKPSYTVRKGELTVFGHTLKSDEIGATEDNYCVSIKESPNKRWSLITYDEPFARGAVWLYDNISKTAPQIVTNYKVIDLPGNN